jgi:copper chaperone
VGDITTRLKTSGMHCRSCSMLVDMTVEELQGVSEVHTDHVTGDTVVTYDAAAVTLDGIIDAIRGAGYDAEPSA